MKTNEKRSDYYLNRFTDFVVVLECNDLGTWNKLEHMTLIDYYEDNATITFTDKKECQKLREKLIYLASTKQIQKTEIIAGNKKRICYVQQKKGIKYNNKI